MQIIKRKIGREYLVFDKTSETIILKQSDLVSRVGVRKLKRVCDISTLGAENIPLGTLIISLERNYNILATNGETANLMLGEKPKNFINILQFIDENKNKFNN